MSNADNVAAEIKSMPKMEILLGAGALAVLLGFILGNTWGALFKFSYTWFPTLAFFGAIGALTLVVLRLFKVEFMPANIRGWVLLGVALLPALGFLIDSLGNFWGALMLAGALVMAYGAATSKVASELTQRVTDRHPAPAAAPTPAPAPAPAPSDEAAHEPAAEESGDDE